jgi:hypothetical protein
MYADDRRASAVASLRREVLAMKCPKCGYTNFPYVESCRKCGHGLAEQREALGIYALRPDPPDLLLAYQAASTEVTGDALTPPASAPGIDLVPVEGIDLHTADLGGESPGSTPTPSESAAVKQVYDLGLDEDLEGLTLEGTADGAGTDDGDEVTEYTLESEEDLKFEVDELELEQDDEVEDGDDDR